MSTSAHPLRGMTRTDTTEIFGNSRRRMGSISATAYLTLADQTADSVKTTSVSCRSTTPESRATRSCGSCISSHFRSRAWRCACSLSRLNGECDALPRSALTESALWRVRTVVAPIRRLRRLSGLTRCGIVFSADWGKPGESRGRKATGLKRGAMTAGLPARRKLFEREQGVTRPPHGLAS